MATALFIPVTFPTIDGEFWLWEDEQDEAGDIITVGSRAVINRETRCTIHRVGPAGITIGRTGHHHTIPWPEITRLDIIEVPGRG